MLLVAAAWIVRSQDVPDCMIDEAVDIEIKHPKLGRDAAEYCGEFVVEMVEGMK